jgi:hypothetical protein
MPSSGMLHRVPLVRTDVTEERIASIIRVNIMSELQKTLVFVLTLLRCFHGGIN